LTDQMIGKPGEGDVRRIAEIEHPVLQNLAITQAYFQISTALAGLCPGANWCTFATWASRQAGQTIRGEDLRGALELRLNAPARITAPLQSLWRTVLRAGFHDPDTVLGRLVKEIHGPLDALEHASVAVSRGNHKVFVEIAQIFARFLAGPAADQTRDQARMTTFCERLNPGEPPDGQQYLRQAFTHYYAALFERDGRARAELMFLANLEIGYHEQIRLQAEICQAFDTPARDATNLGVRVLTCLFPHSAKWWTLFRTPSASLLGPLARAFARFCLDINRQVITECLMTLRLPRGNVLRLGEKLDAPAASSLAEITNPELRGLLAAVESLRPGGGAVDVRDWSDFAQRIQFIAHLFRAYHEWDPLFDPPFSPEQVRQFQSGYIPDGDL